MHLTRRTFLGLSVAATGALPLVSREASKGRKDQVEEVSLADLAAGMAAGRWSSQELVLAYLTRIRALDASGPALRSVIEINPDAMGIAKALDAERRAKGVRGPLHGIPVLLKDNLDTADRMKTTAGSLFLVDAPVPSRDAFVVQRLREAGAVILGKTNLSEWANFRSTRSTSGWSGRGGQTRHPYALDRNPSGSSSGSAVAVAASLCAAAVGTETDGSIVSPSSTCGIVGLKPTVGLLSRSGIIPISHSQDTAGPMARSVWDAAMLLGAMVGQDGRDPATEPSRGKSVKDYTKGLTPEGLRGARLGWLKSSPGGHPHMEKLMSKQRTLLTGLGAEVVDVEIQSAAYEAAEFDVLLYEFKADLKAYFEGRGLPGQDLGSLMAFNEAHAAQEMPFFDQESMVMAQAKGPLTDPAYVKALETCRKGARELGIDKVLTEHKLDAIVAPTGGPAWLTDHVNADHYGGSCASHAAVAGYPHITVPAGDVFGLPVGLSFFGTAWSEPILFKLAFAFEQAAHARRPPRYLPTLPV